MEAMLLVDSWGNRFTSTGLIGETGGTLPDAARASGGIGRRAGFRFLCPQGREGSSPSSRTHLSLPVRRIIGDSSDSIHIDDDTTPDSTCQDFHCDSRNFIQTNRLGH